MTPIPKCSVIKCKHHQIFSMGMCERHYQEWLAWEGRLQRDKAEVSSGR